MNKPFLKSLSAHKALVRIVALSSAISFVAFMINPSIPYLIKGFVKTEEATATTLGILKSAGALVLVVASLLGGVLADRLGRKKILLISVGVGPIALFLYLVAMNWYWLILASFATSLTLGLSQPSFNALIADSTPGERRATAYGIYNLLRFLILVPAPILGGYLAVQIGFKSPFLAALFIWPICVLLAFKIIEPKAENTSFPFSSEVKKDAPTMSFKASLSIFCSLSLLIGLANGILGPLIPLFLIFNLKADILQMGIAFSIGFTLVSALVQGPGGKLADKVGRKKMMLTGMLMAPFIVALSYSQNLLQFILIIGLITAIGNIGLPAFMALLMDLIPSEKRARASGVVDAGFGIGSIVGPLIGGFLWTTFESEVFIPFFVPSVLFFSTGLLILMLKEKRSKKTTSNVLI